MTNFKGTKGKWEFSKTHQIITDQKGWGIAQENGVRNSHEWKYNSLLISKAPEMLEMLEKLVNTYELLGLSNEVKQLIKEATEL